MVVTITAALQVLQTRQVAKRCRKRPCQLVAVQRADATVVLAMQCKPHDMALDTIDAARTHVRGLQVRQVAKGSRDGARQVVVLEIPAARNHGLCQQRKP